MKKLEDLNNNIFLYKKFKQFYYENIDNILIII
jgi:hypothetical protein